METVDLERLGVTVLTLRRRSWETATRLIWWQSFWRRLLWITGGLVTGAALWAITH